MIRFVSKNRPTAAAMLVAIVLAVGWAMRETSFAAEKAVFLKSQTINMADLKFEDHVFEGKPRGDAALYFRGETHGTKSLMAGQFRLKPGEEPHPIHTHADEEILIVAKGEGEITCNGVTTKVGAGSLMLTGPNVPHGIKNTGDDVLVFYFVKWVGVSR